MLEQSLQVFELGLVIWVMMQFAGVDGFGEVIGDLDNFPGDLGDSINPDILDFP